MQLFFLEADLKQQFNSGKRDIELPGDEAAHLKVLRLRPGENISITDGLGNICTGEVVENTPRSNLIVLKSLTTVKPKPYSVHIAVAPTKNIARFEWFLEKATEMGIDEITPFFSDHSERVNLRIDRLNKVLISAMKQSLKAYLPKVNQPVSLNEFLNRQLSPNGNTFIAWLDRGQPLPHLKKVCKPQMPATILIGPEGDFSVNEVELAKSRGYMPVTLGTSRLRTETAALTACFVVNLLNEPDFHQFDKEA